MFFDNTLVTVTIDQAIGQADPIGVNPMNFTVVFSEPIDPTTFTASDILFSGTSIGVVAAPPTSLDNITWTVAAFASAPGTIIATIPSNAIMNLTVRTNSASTSVDNQITFDNVAPTVTIDEAITQQDPTNANPVNFTVVFSEPINPTTFTASDITITGTATIIPVIKKNPFASCLSRCLFVLWMNGARPEWLMVY